MQQSSVTSGQLTSRAPLLQIDSNIQITPILATPSTSAISTLQSSEDVRISESTSKEQVNN